MIFSIPHTAENILLEGGPQFSHTHTTSTDLGPNPTQNSTDLELNSGPNNNGSLHPIDQAVILSLCLDVENSNPQDGLTYEEMFPYVTRVLKIAQNWMIHSTGE